MTELCFRILPAARAAYGGLDEIGGQYVGDVAKDTRLPAYFRAMQYAAALPDQAGRLARFWSLYDQDAQMILNAGLRELEQAGALSESERAVAEAMRDMERWAFP